MTAIAAISPPDNTKSPSDNSSSTSRISRSSMPSYRPASNTSPGNAAYRPAVTRLLPGVLGDAESAVQDSFMAGLLDHPHYTRPEDVAGQKVPAVLLSGDHAQIARWRYKQALGRSFLRRPDLVSKLDLDREQQALLDEFLKESGKET